MAFRFGDPGGRMYTSVGTSNVNMLAYWTVVSSTGGGSGWSVSAGNGRISGSCLRLTSTSGQVNYLVKTLDAQPTWGVAFAFRCGVLPAVGNNVPIIAAFDDAGSAQVDLRVNADATLSVTRNGTVLGTTAVPLPLNAYCHLEMKVTVHPSAGTVALYVNGVQRLNLTGQNTRNTANSSANQFRIGNSVSFWSIGGSVDWDDIIVYDGQTTDANGYADITGPVGDCALTWLLPTGAGTTTQFTPDTGANYARVNEATPDGDTSYVESLTVGNTDTYAMADLGASAAVVKSVAVCQFARKSDPGTKGMKAVLRSGGGNTPHATETVLGTSYQYAFSAFGQDPNNGAAQAWSVAAVNALEAGQTVSS